MNIQQAQEKIREAKVKNSKILDLSLSSGNKRLNRERLTSEDLNKLLPEITELTALSELNLGANRISDIKFIAQLKGLTRLHLNHNDISDIEPLAQLTQLEMLDLRFNKLTDVEFLSELNQLIELTLSVNEITSIKPLSKLSSLKYLNLHRNQINNPEPLSQLEGLTDLKIGFNKIKNFEFLRQLTALQSVSLNNSQISNVKFLEKLHRLESLDLSDNKIADFESLTKIKELKILELGNNQIINIEFLNNLPELLSVDLSQNHIVNFAPLTQLTNLINLNLINNQLDNIDFLGQLQELRFLVLVNNSISNIEVLAQLKKLERLNLESNQINNIEILMNLTKLKDLNVRKNPVENPPMAVVKQGLNAIKKYFADNAKQKYEYVYETKVLLVGETETGKTTLFNKLLDPKYLPSKASKIKKKSTVGINIKTWEFPFTNDPRETVKANLWDFGGQEIQYTLHQYFLTKSSFYIFLISNRVGDNEKIHKADYWFKVISALGKDCPVLVILNERNDSSANTFDITKYIRQFGANLGEIEKLDVNFDKNDTRWNHLLETLKRKISNLTHIGEETEDEKKRNFKKGLPEKWVKIREELETLAETNNYIKRSAYDEICQRMGVFENSERRKKSKILSQDLLLGFLHNLGVIINFEDALLRNYLILNPNWLTKSLYLALENKIVKDEYSGKVTSRFIEKLWRSKSYSDEDFHILLNLMLKDNFEIAYKVEGKQDDYVIPMLLPDVPLEYQFDVSNAITIIVRFVFMPYGVFSRLVVQLNNYIDVQDLSGNEKQIVWKKGMLLRSRLGSVAEVLESDDREQTPKEIRIRVAGENIDENKRFLELIVSRINQINHDWFNDNLEFDELVPCTCKSCKEIENDGNKKLHSFKTIKKFLSKNIYEIHCDKSAEIVNLGELFNGVYIESSLKSGDNYYFFDETQFIKEARDSVSIKQRIETRIRK